MVRTAKPKAQSKTKLPSSNSQSITSHSLSQSKPAVTDVVDIRNIVLRREERDECEWLRGTDKTAEHRLIEELAHTSCSGTNHNSKETNFNEEYSDEDSDVPPLI